MFLERSSPNTLSPLQPYSLLPLSFSLPSMLVFHVFCSKLPQPYWLKTTPMCFLMVMTHSKSDTSLTGIMLRSFLLESIGDFPVLSRLQRLLPALTPDPLLYPQRQQWGTLCAFLL
jgi:hypothetical protein